MQHYLPASEAEHTFVTAAAQFTVAGDDIELARRSYEETYGGSRFTVRRGEERFAFRYASIGDERMTLRTSSFTGHLAGEVPYLRDYVVSWFRSGAGELHRRGRTPATTTSAPFLLPSEQHFAFAFTPHRQHLVHFSPAFLEDVATELHAGRARAISFDHDATPRAEAIEQWRAAVSTASAVLTDAATAPLLRVNAQRPLALALLRLFPWFGVELPHPLREPSLARTRAALEFFQHHAHEPITPADAARAAGLHTRTLQQLCRRHLGQSPTAYLRGVRLDRARRDLRAATPETATVAAIAHAWGFGHLGRFPGAFQTQFGERPCDVLRR